MFCLRHHRHRGAALHGQQPAAFRCTRVLSCSAYKLVAPQSPHKEDLNWQRSHHYAELPRNHWVQLVVGRRASKPGLLKTAGAAVERNRTRKPHSLMTRKRRPRGPPPKRPRCVCCSAPPWKVFTIPLPPDTPLPGPVHRRSGWCCPATSTASPGGCTRCGATTSPPPGRRAACAPCSAHRQRFFLQTMNLLVELTIFATGCQLANEINSFNYPKACGIPQGSGSHPVQSSAAPVWSRLTLGGLGFLT